MSNGMDIADVREVMMERRLLADYQSAFAPARNIADKNKKDFTAPARSRDVRSLSLCDGSTKSFNDTGTAAYDPARPDKTGMSDARRYSFPTITCRQHK
jgi:hypothetical protein